MNLPKKRERVRSGIARAAAEARCLECLANPGGFDGPTGAE